jgi:hypothetical protein
MQWGQHTSASPQLLLRKLLTGVRSLHLLLSRLPRIRRSLLLLLISVPSLLLLRGTLNGLLCCCMC